MKPHDEFTSLIQCLVSFYNDKQYYGDIFYTLDGNELKLSWKTGEDSGGNCWGDEASYSKSDVHEPDFSLVDNLFISLSPSFSLKSYLDFKASIRYDSNSTREYYGNGSYYDIKIIKLDTLLSIIQQENIDLHKMIPEVYVFTDDLFKANKTKNSY